MAQFFGAIDKLGLAPVMRDGIEYEFDVCGDMDHETRCRSPNQGVRNLPEGAMHGREENSRIR